MGKYEFISDDLLFQLNENNLGNTFLRFKDLRGLKEPMISDITRTFTKFELHSYYNSKTSKLKKIALNYVDNVDPEAIYIAIRYSADMKLTDANQAFELVKNSIYKDMFKNLKGCNKDKIKALRIMEGMYPSPDLESNEYEVLIINLC